LSTERNSVVGKIAPQSWAALVLSAVVILGTPVMGHHSFAALYIEADTVEIEGDVVEFQYKNPHSWVFVQGQEGLGPTKIYAAEWTGTSQLERLGIAKNFFHVGDRVQIWVSPGRDPNDNRVRLKRIERRSDGFKWGQNRGERR
jgi:Family of unknown function (DUF6152)